jgi:hypothetical protein
MELGKEELSTTALAANLHAHLVAAAANCLTVEYFVLGQDVYTFERLVTPETRLCPQDGILCGSMLVTG